MTQRPAIAEKNSHSNAPDRRQRAWRLLGRSCVTGLVLAGSWLPGSESRAGNPVATATWYCPYTPEGDCTPYTRSYGYTPTRWRKWPTVAGKKGPETISAPTPAKPSEEIPAPDESLTPSLTPEVPGPSDETDMAPLPPGGEPTLPDGKPIPQEDMHDLFNDDGTTTPEKPQADSGELFDDGKDGTGTESEPMDHDATEPEESESSPPAGTSRSRHGARQTSFTSSSSDSKILWRRSKRLTPTDVWPSDAETRSANVGTGAGTSAGGKASTFNRPALRPSSNPLRAGSTQSLPAAGVNSSQVLAGSDAVPAAAYSSASPGWRANPLRSGQ